MRAASYAPESEACGSVLVAKSTAKLTALPNHCQALLPSPHLIYMPIAVEPTYLSIIFFISKSLLLEPILGI